MESIFTWTSFFWLAAVLLFLLFVLKFIGKISQYIFKKKSTKDKLRRIFNTVEVVYKPLAIIIVLLSFLSIDFMMHGILLLAAGIISFTHVKSYVNGVLFKTNKLVEKNAYIITGKFEGEIEELLPFGVIINLTEGKRFINYSFIEKQGFYINQQDEGTLRNTIYLSNSVNPEKVLDLLFENPMVSISNKPQIKEIVGKKMMKLQLTLEKGVQIESLISFLNQHDIESNINATNQ